MRYIPKELGHLKSYKNVVWRTEGNQYAHCHSKSVYATAKEAIAAFWAAREKAIEDSTNDWNTYSKLIDMMMAASEITVSPAPASAPASASGATAHGA